MVGYIFWPTQLRLVESNAGNDQVSAITIYPKGKHCLQFTPYNEVHYHTSSVVVFANGKINKQTKMVDKLEQRQISEKQIYNQRERGRRESERKNILHRLSVYLIFIM